MAATGKRILITISPSALGAEYLTVADAMHQVLDFISAVEMVEGAAKENSIVWRLTEAHTNSPPFTIEATAYSRDPTLSISYEATRVAAVFSDGLLSLLSGEAPSWMEPDVAAPLKRALARNLNGVGKTSLDIEGGLHIDVVPSNARTGLIAIDRALSAAKAEVEDLRRTEYGSIQAEVLAITRYHGAPALLVLERLSGQRVTCIIDKDLVSDLGTAHVWSEAWEGRHLLISGALHYDAVGTLKRVNVTACEEVEWANISISDLPDIDLLRASTVSAHLAEFWGDDDA